MGRTRAVKRASPEEHCEIVKILTPFVLFAVTGLAGYHLGQALTPTQTWLTATLPIWAGRPPII